MINIIQKFLIPYVFNEVKIYLAIISVLFFTLLYSICENDEFHGWVDTKKIRSNEEKKFLQSIYKKYVGKDGFIHLNKFKEIPIIMKDNKFFLTDEDDEASEKKEEIKNREMLFKIFDKNNENKITEKMFMKMPLKLDMVSKFSQGYSTTYPDQQNNNNNAVNTIFDRFYFSCIIQSNLGLGDIYPSSRRVRLIMLLQVFVTYVIIILPYSSFFLLK